MEVSSRIRRAVAAGPAAERRLARLPAVRGRYRLPDFLGLGSAQSGSTWLFDNLGKHPDVRLPARKEIHYWTRHHDKPLWWYARFFRGTRGWLTGEVSPSYVFLPVERVREVRALLPDVRLVVLLRNPVDREFSRARRLLAQRAAAAGRDPGLTDVTEEELLAEVAGRSPRARHSDHARNLERWRSVFPPEQLHVDFFDRLSADPAGLLADVTAHLGLRPWLPEGVRDRVNVNPDLPMPESVRALLRERYAPVVEEVAEVYGGAALAWRTSLHT